MPQLDKYHGVVKRALQKEGWAIIQDPLYLRRPDVKVFIDLVARRHTVGIIDTVAIEVKVLESPALNHELATAFGQYLIYRAILELQHPSHRLYLAVPEEIYYNLLTGPTFQKILVDNRIYLMVFQPETEEIVLWTH